MILIVPYKILEINDNLVIIDGISDPGNLGAIFRTAAWYNIQSIILTSDCVDPFNLKCLRSGVGAHFYFQNIVNAKREDVIKFLGNNNYDIYCADLNGIILSDVKLKNNEKHQESKTYKPGNKLVTIKLPWGNLGLTICFDLRFPEIYRNLSKKNVHFISVPSAFTKITGKKHWLELLKARAIENFCYIFAPNHTGRNTKQRETFGHSVIISPDGKILKIKKKGTGIICTKINPKLSMDLRKIIPSVSFH